MMTALFSLFLGLLSSNLIAANLAVMEGTKVSNDTMFVSTTNGKVGIKNNSPSSVLDVIGDSSLRGSVTVTSTLTVSGNAFSVGASTFVVTGGNIGMGTATPSAALHIRGLVGHRAVLLMDNSAGSGDPQIHFISSIAGGSIVREAGTENITIGASGDSGNNLFYGASHFLYGRVGINLTLGATQSPSEVLQISSGTIHLDGTGSPATGAALCINSAGKLTACTSGVGAGGTCTCP